MPWTLLLFYTWAISMAATKSTIGPGLTDQWLATACKDRAAELRQNPVVRDHFLRIILLAMFDEAGGYSRHHVYFNEFEAKWTDHDPEQVECAARASLYVPNFYMVQQWVGDLYPELAHALWTPWTHGKLCCCSRALQDMD